MRHFDIKSAYDITGDKEKNTKYRKYLWVLENLHKPKDEKKNTNLLCLKTQTAKNRKQRHTKIRQPNINNG
jgi:hypothetical protein